MMKKITKISQKGIDLIKKYEGFSEKPYFDPGTGNLPITIGYGSTYYEDGKKVTMQDALITESRGVELLKNLLISFEKSVDSFCRDDINQNQFDALVSFAYNVGVNALKNSTLLKKLNANPNDPTIKDEFLKWVNAGGKKLPGLVKRREEEAALYFS
jgi:lysozyme